jgi:NAD(P)-dependent dehydrogenase (short-subunit alcohol dehydrogenase family)
MDLSDKVIFITGGTSGMAKATVYRAVQAWASVAFLARRKEKWEAIVHNIIDWWIDADRIAFYKGDVTDFTLLADIINQVHQQFWRIDGLFCCAGRHIVGDVLTTSLADRDALWKLNTTHMFMAMKSIIPIMQDQWSWSIVLMWSDQTHIAKRTSSIYGASKAAIGQLTKSTALDFADDGIRVNCVCPWTIETPQALNNAEKLAHTLFDGDINAAKHELAQGQFIDRWWQPEEVANLVCFLLSAEARFMTWSLVSIDGGYTAG